MTNVKMHYDGWVQLPVGLRRKLALETNVQLEAVLTEDGILLRPARAKPARTSATEPEAPPKVPAQVQKPTRKPRALNWPPFRADTRFNPGGLGICPSIGLYRTTSFSGSR